MMFGETEPAFVGKNDAVRFEARNVANTVGEGVEKSGARLLLVGDKDGLDSARLTDNESPLRLTSNDAL